MTVQPRSAAGPRGGFDEAVLQGKLDAAFSTIERKRVLVAACEAGRRGYAGVGGEADAADEPERRGLPTGCLTKLLVGALIEKETVHGRLAYDDEAADLFEVTGRGLLSGTTVKHLLEHTHGLDDSALACAPTRNGGFIDTDSLLGRLRTQRFAAPGALYSYSNAGAWLLAAMLERIHGRPFEQQLREHLLGALGLRERRCHPSLVPEAGRAICPP